MSEVAPAPRTGPVAFVVQVAEAGKRLDRLVSDHVDGVGRRGAARLFEQGRVRVNGRRVRKSARANAGDRVEVALQDDAPPADESVEVHVVFEAPAVVVVSKPAGVPTVPVTPGEGATLAGALVARFPECSAVGHRRREPGVVHRLDTWTSGLVVCARSEHAFDVLTAALGRGELRKRYLAVVDGAGLADRAVVTAPLRPDARRRGRVEAIAAGVDTAARPSRTSLRVVERSGRWALVEAEASPAYRHQLRAHLAWLGHPIAGDTLYGGPDVGWGNRHALHASHVDFDGSGEVPRFDVDDPLPADLTELLRGAGR